MRPTAENAGLVWTAIEQFGAPRHNIRREDFCTPDVVFQIGIEPNRIDILTSISSVEFDEAWPTRRRIRIDELALDVIGREQLLKNKLASARPKDLFDAQKLNSNESNS